MTQTNPEVSVVPTIEHYRDTLLRIAETDWHTRRVRCNPDGGMRGQAGMIAVRALTGQNGSYLTNDAVRELVEAQTPPATQPSATVGEVEAITAAITAADADFSYSYRLTGLNDGVEEHTLFMPGFEPATFADRQDGYAVIAERRNRLRAEAVLATLHTPPPVATATVVNLTEDEIAEAISDSLDTDWTPRDGAKAVMKLLAAGSVRPIAKPTIPPGWKRYTGSSAPEFWNGGAVLLLNGNERHLTRESEQWKLKPPFHEGTPYSIIAYRELPMRGNCEMPVRDCECN